MNSDQAESIAIRVLVTGQRRICQNLTQPSRILKSAVAVNAADEVREEETRQAVKKSLAPENSNN